MKRLIFATGNHDKIREAAEILGDGYVIWTPEMYGITEEIPETGDTLRKNSIQKAMYVHERAGMDCFADDTGLEVNVLNGAPGVNTARYAGPWHDSAANMAKLLKEMEGKTDRRACFRTVVTLYMDKGLYTFEGEVKGRIGFTQHGHGGFGYDPVFIPDEIPDEKGRTARNVRDITMAELSEEQKNLISHRGKALRAMADFLRTLQ